MASSSRSTRNVVADVRAGRARGKRPAGQRAAPSGGFWEGVRALLGTFAIFLVIRAFLVEAFRIPSGSMIPTLLVGDWLFVNKLVYGPHIPFTSASLPGYAEPKRGEVMVFVSPYQPDEAARGEDPTPTLVKRIVGVPGDTLHMRGGLLHVNGIPQRQGFAAGANPVGDPNEVSDLFAWQRDHALARSRFGAAPAQPTHDNWGPLVVPPSRYFMLGDNRYCSKDSRYWGLVPRENVRGRPIFVYYSYRPGPGPDLTAGGCSGEVSARAVPFITDIRWGRIGDAIR